MTPDKDEVTIGGTALLSYFDFVKKKSGKTGVEEMSRSLDLWQEEIDASRDYPVELPNKVLGYINERYGDKGIKVTNIYPGETNTPIVEKRPQPPPPEKRARMLQPEDIAACVVTVAKLPPRAVVPELVITPPHMPYA